MLKQGTFINKKFYNMLIFSLLGMFIDTFNTMLDAILGGNQLGEIALQAVSIVSPLSYIIAFFGYLFAPGCAILYGVYIGEFKKKEANRAAGTSLVSSLILGIIGAVLFIIIKKPFLNYYGCTGELLANASSYYNWFIVRMFLFPLSTTMYSLVITEGATFFVMIGTIGQILSNMILSYVLCSKIGIAGLAIATVISRITVMGVYVIYFCLKRCSVRFALSLDFKILKKSIILSVKSALNFIFIAVVDIIMNKIIIMACGQIYVSAYAVVNLILEVFLTTGGSSDACQGILTSFVGEKNNYGAHNILKTGMKSVIILNIILMIGLFFAAPVMPLIYGLTTPEIVAAAERATRILCVSAIPFGIAYFAFNIYTCLNKPLLSIIMSFLYNFFCPLILSIPLAFVMGFDGVSIGMSASSFLVIALFIWFICSRYGKAGFPWYLKETGEEAFGYDLYVTKETIPEIRDKVKAELDNHGYKIDNIEILIEELYTRIYEKNMRKTVCSECVLLFGENHVRIIVRDSGVIFNFVDVENKIESLNAYVLNSLLEKVKDKQYLITTSFNRNAFMFGKI